MEQRHRRLVAASCCIWLLTVVALVSCQNAPDVAGLRSLATEGDAAAQFDLGDRYFTGEGVPQDDGEALRWFRLAAAQGHARAQASLGFMYATGEGVPQDDGEAARWYRLAADQGYAAAQFSLGVKHFSGEGVPQDDGEALRWFRLAAAQGHAGAQNNLGLMYRDGRGVSQDDSEALRWYRLAADQGHARAQFTLGRMYGAGQGVPQDYVTAHKWANLAAAQGHENAREWRDTFAEAINAEQRAAREPPPAPAPSSQQAVVSNISFEEIDDQFRAGGPLTDLQKGELWKQYQGKCVEWRGELAYLDEGFLGGLSIGFKHRRETFTYDVLVSAPRSERETLLTWQQGSSYVYRATLRSAPGVILPLRADWGCEGMYQPMQDLLRQPDTPSFTDAPRAALSGPRVVGNVLPLTRSSGERCFEDEICPSPWIQYERTTNFPGQEPETQDAWSCQSRSSWCWVAGGEGCFCSGTQPPGTWTRVDDRSDVSVVPNLWAAPLPPVTDLLPGETHVAWDKLEVGNIYRLMNSVDLTTWGRNGPVQGLRFINAWRIIVVRKIDRLVPDDPWYYVRVVTPGSFSDPDNDGDGWIKGTEFMELGVAEQP